MRRWFDLCNENADELARILTSEQGKPLAEAKGEVGYGSSFFEWFSEEARRINGDVSTRQITLIQSQQIFLPLPQIVPAPVANRQMVFVREPIGVAAMITPWNFPNAMITRKVHVNISHILNTVENIIVVSGWSCPGFWLHLCAEAGGGHTIVRPGAYGPG